MGTMTPYEPDWPEADVIMGNPPFLGGNRQRGELGDKYLEDLWTLYDGRVPGSADLVCYWYEKARAQLEKGKVKRIGLLATNSIRGGTNREVLERIKQTGDIFMAWSDRPWVLEGAAVRISIVGFDGGEEEAKVLDSKIVSAINSDLTTSVDLTKASELPENNRICFRSDEKGGPFDIEAGFAQEMLNSSGNPNGRPNSDVVRPYVNGLDVTRRPQNMWVIDFGIETPEVEAAKYKAPFEYVKRVVKPVRDKVNNERERTYWWLHRRPAPDMRQAVANFDRFIATPAVAKHRLFVWLDSKTIPDHQLYIFARDDDYFFGVLHSYLHEIWSLRLGTSLEDRPRYTPTTTFETFPFPWPPGSEDAASPHYAAIAEAARALHEERDAWLNPPDDLLNGPARERLLRERTLTNLYNAVEEYRRSLTPTPDPSPEFRGGEKRRRNGQTAAQAFAPRLAELHDALDRAALAAYGWDDISPHPLTPSPLHGEGEHGSVYMLRTTEGDEELLRRLLALNLARA